MDDDDEGWTDEVELLSEAEKEELDASILPVRLVIVKVRDLDNRRQRG
jgi:hypothetical protein